MVQSKIVPSKLLQDRRRERGPRCGKSFWSSMIGRTLPHSSATRRARFSSARDTLGRADDGEPLGVVFRPSMVRLAALFVPPVLLRGLLVAPPRPRREFRPPRARSDDTPEASTSEYDGTELCPSSAVRPASGRIETLRAALRSLSPGTKPYRRGRRRGRFTLWGRSPTSRRRGRPPPNAAEALNTDACPTTSPCSRRSGGGRLRRGSRPARSSLPMARHTPSPLRAALRGGGCRGHR